MEDLDYNTVRKWTLQTKGSTPETIATCLAENKIIAIEYFAQVKRLTVDQLLEIFQVNQLK